MGVFFPGVALTKQTCRRVFTLFEASFGYYRMSSMALSDDSGDVWNVGHIIIISTMAVTKKSAATGTSS